MCIVIPAECRLRNDHKGAVFRSLLAKGTEGGDIGVYLMPRISESSLVAMFGWSETVTFTLQLINHDEPDRSVERSTSRCTSLCHNVVKGSDQL